MKNIVFTGDLLRPTMPEREPNQTTNILWLWSLLGHQVEEAVSQHILCITPEDSTFGFGKCWSAGGESPSLEIWAKWFHSAPEPVM